MKYKRFSPSTININTHPHLKYVSKCWQTMDGKYDILYDKVDGYTHLRIQRIDNKPIHNYMDLQEIKNDLLGNDVIAIEIYPAQKDFKNCSNTYHIWTWKGIEAPNLSKIYKYKEQAKRNISGKKWHRKPLKIEEATHSRSPNTLKAIPFGGAMDFINTVNFLTGNIVLPINAYWWATGNPMWFLGLVVLPGWIIGYFHVKRKYCTWYFNRYSFNSLGYFPLIVQNVNFTNVGRN